MLPYYLLFVFSILISSLSQALLKLSTMQPKRDGIRGYLNAKSGIAYTLFFASTLLTVIAFRFVPLSSGAMLESLGYVFVPVFSLLMLKESMSRRKILGSLVIMAGIVIFSI